MDEREEIKGREGRLLLLAQRVLKIPPSPRWVVAARRATRELKKEGRDDDRRCAGNEKTHRLRWAVSIAIRA